MIPEPDEELKQTTREKILFHITAFFVLVGIFSLFAFLFLVPFVVDPALSTISAAFDPNPADCVTISLTERRGNSNCSWASCREGCTREVYECKQVRVDYRRMRLPGEVIGDEEEEEEEGEEGDAVDDEDDEEEEGNEVRRRRDLTDLSDSWGDGDYKEIHRRFPRAKPQEIPSGSYVSIPHPVFVTNFTEETGNESLGYVFYSGARLFPNVKGCGYPPILNCNIWHDKHAPIGARYPCHYSRIDPGLVISQLDMHAVYMDLVYAVLIPVPSFIISVVYLAFAYFKIYNEEEEVGGEEGAAAEGGEEDGEGKEGSEVGVEGKEEDATAAVIKSPTASEGGGGGGGVGEVGAVKATSEGGVGNGVAGGGSLSGGKAGSPTSGDAVKGNLTKTMTTSITPPPGPIAEV